MLKYSTTKGTAFGKGNVNDGLSRYVNNNNNNNNVVSKLAVCSPSKLPSFPTTLSTNNQIYRKWPNGANLDNNVHATYNITEIVKIYTDWANHYLEKGQKKRLIQDLQKDMQDSILLIDVIEAVVGEKVPNVKRKPKNTAQVVENIGYCLQYLSSLGVSLEGLVAKDIRDGQLKSILGLFFSLSRYKQQQKSMNKQQLQQNGSSIPTPANNAEMLSKLPSPFRNNGTTTTAAVNGSVSQQSVNNNANSLNNNKQTNSGGNSTELASSTNAQSKSSNCADSSVKIKTTTTTITTTASSASITTTSAKSTSSNSGKVLGSLKQPSTVKVPASNGGSKTVVAQQNSSNHYPYTTTSSSTSTTTTATSGPPSSSNLPAPKDAKMLDKLKLFASSSKDKSSAIGSNSPRLPKSSTRASNSSSGFSSAKSELSDVSYEPPTSAVASSSTSGVGGNSKLSVKSSFGKKSSITSSSTKPSPKTSRKDYSKNNSSSSNNDVVVVQQTSPQLMKKQHQKSSSLVVECPSTKSGNKLLLPNEITTAGVGETTNNDAAATTTTGGCNSNSSKLLASSTSSKLKPVTSPTCTQIAGFGGGGVKSGASGSIPKPTLAVKGMKPVSTNKQIGECQNDVRPQQQQVDAKSSSINSGDQLTSTNNLKHSNSTSIDQQEREKFLQTYKAQRSYSSAMMKPSTPSSPVTVGVVSPITHHKKLPSAVNSSASSANVNVNTGGGITNAGGGSMDLNSSLDSQGGHQSDSNSSHTSGNQSDTASVIYCPSADEKECLSTTTAGGTTPTTSTTSMDQLRRNKSKSPAVSLTDENMQKLRELSSSPARTQSRLETTFDSSDGVVVTQTVALDDDEPQGLTGAEEEVASSIQPMQPLIPRASPYAYLRGLTTLSGKPPSSAGCPQQQQMQQQPPLDQQLQTSVAASIVRSSRAKSPRLLFNKPLASLLHTDINGDGGGGNGNGGRGVEEMDVVVGCESSNNSSSLSSVKCAAGEVAAGYVSESDVALQLSDQIDLDISGYMSEGGISLYARKLQARFREGLELAQRDSMRKTTDIIDDSFEDSSSLSSGISETIDEISTDDLTGSSLSDQAINPYGSLKRNFHHNGKLLTNAACIRKSESSQQTDRVIGPNSSKFAFLNGGASAGGHQHRKLSDQYDPQRIDSLLQKCRTSTRGLNAVNQRPKSEQMNGRSTTISMQQQRPNGRTTTTLVHPEIELSADGQTLNISSPSSNFTYRRVPPLTMNSLHVLKRVDQQTQQNGGSDTIQVIGARTSSAGYHSLDRKKHLLNNGGDHLKYCSESEALYVNYPPPRSNAGAALALVSPRHVASLKKGAMSLPVSHEGPLPVDEKDMAEAWMRHVNGQTSSMSRSMIEPEVKLSTSSPSSSSGQERMNGHARLSVPPQQTLSLAAALQQATNGILQGTSMQCRSPRTNHRNSTASTQSESGVAHKESNETSPSSQLYLHKLMSTTGSINAPPSPGSLSAPATSRLSNHSHGYNNSPYLGNVLDKVGVLEEVHGSSLSLASSSSSVYSTSEEKYQSEIRKLHRDLEAYKEKVQTLTSHHATYAHVVAAFEQSLQSMTKRVQSLTAASEQKDCELTDLKSKISVLREMSVARGLNFDELLLSPGVQRRHTFNNTNESPGLVRQLSSESMNSVASHRSSVSAASYSRNDKAVAVSSSVSGIVGDKKGKKSWLRSSFTKAFGKTKKNKNGSMSDVEENQLPSDTSNPASPMHTPRNTSNGQLKTAGSSSALNEGENDENVHILKIQLMHKDSALTDVRLDALTRAHELDEMKEVVGKYKKTVENLQSENERLRSMIACASRAPSQSSLPIMSDDNDSVSEGGNVLSDMSVPVSVDAAGNDNRGYRVTLTVNFNLAGDTSFEKSNSYALIGSLCLSHKTKWDLLDTIVSKLFKEHVLRLDQVSNLGLSAESILGYNVGGVTRLVLEPIPQALPSSYLNENKTNLISVSLRGCNQNAVDALAFETLIPKTIVQRYVSSLLEHRRIIISGFCGTGKTYLARKLAEYVVTKCCRNCDSSSVVIFNIENQSVGVELKKYLSRLADHIQQETSQTNEFPVVIILDNLQKIASLSDVFASLLHLPVTSCPYIIGTTTEPSNSTTNLQLHHNFRWVSCATNSEPVKGLLSRYLRRRQIENEVHRGSRSPAELVAVLEWLPKVWTHLNKFLETVNSPQTTIGPRLFLGCPLDIDESREWFINLWNENIVPYLSAVVKEGIQINLHRNFWEDPTEFVLQSWPWCEGELPDSLLSKLRLEDVENDLYDGSSKSFLTSDSDPLIMLMRIQEQARKEREKKMEMNYINLRQNGVESTL